MNIMDRLEQINEMLEENPHDDFLNYAAALEFKKRNDIDRSIALLVALIQRNSEYLPAYYQLGKLYELGGKPEDAKKVYQKGTAIAEVQKEQKTLTELIEAFNSLD